MTTALEGGEGSASRPGRSLPPGKTWYPLYRELDGSQGRSGQVRKISPPAGFDPRTVQPVDSRYTVYATRPTPVNNVTFNIRVSLFLLTVRTHLRYSLTHVGQDEYNLCDVRYTEGPGGCGGREGYKIHVVPSQV
jgi:hypothetical protein